MQWQYTPYVWALAASAVITAVLGAYAWRRRTVPGAGTFSCTMVMVTFWSLTNALEMSSAELAAKLFWANTQYFSSAAIPIAWLVTSLKFTDHDRWLAGRRIALLCVIPSITLIVVWTNDLHGLLRHDIYLDTAGNFPVVGKSYGPWFWVHATYSYGLLLASLLPLAAMVLRTPAAYLGQPLALLTGATFPALGNIAYILGVSPIRRFDVTPVMFGFGGLVVCWGLFRHRLFNLVPLARDRVFEVMSDGVVVLDAAGKIVDMNGAARALLGHPTVEELRTGQVLGSWPAMVELSLRSSPGRAEIVTGTEDAPVHYDVQMSTLTDRSGRLTGRVMAMHDVTGSRWAHGQWLQQQRTLAMLEARERLEREIAEALHSKVQSKLLVAWHQLGECRDLIGQNPEQIEARLDEARDLIDEIRRRDIHQASHRLHPSIISFGLVPAIRTLSESFEEHFDVALHIDSEVERLDSPLENRIPEFMRLAIYRVLEEALSNIDHHAGATSVNISISVDEERKFNLMVQDNGCGFDTANMKRGLGLSGIAGRVEETGGMLKIASSIGHGTAISAVFPSFEQWDLE